MLSWDELPIVNGEDGGKYNDLMAKYQHRGCPGLQMEDICAHDSSECAAKGRCRKAYENVYARQQQIEENKTLPGRERVCIECRRRPVEIIDDYVSDHCGCCSDRMAERDRERREFEHYHP